MTDYHKICAQLQIQRNQFADAHATAAARAETLAEDIDRVKAELMAEQRRWADIARRQGDEIAHLKFKIAELEKPKPEMLPVTIDECEPEGYDDAYYPGDDQGSLL